MKQHLSQKGSALTYILLALFLSGILIMSMSEGSRRNAQTQQLDEMGMMLQADIGTIEAAVNDCVLTYPSAIDRDGDNDKDQTDNPNTPFPIIYDSTTGYAMTGVIAKAVCLGAPPTPLTTPTAATKQQLLVNAQGGRSLRLIGNTANYTTTLTTDTAEGVYIRITRVAASTLWTENLSRLNDRFSACKAAVFTAPGACVNGCFYYWIKRPTTSVIGIPEAGCTL